MTLIAQFHVYFGRALASRHAPVINIIDQFKWSFRVVYYILANSYSLKFQHFENLNAE